MRSQHVCLSLPFGKRKFLETCVPWKRLQPRKKSRSSQKTRDANSCLAGQSWWHENANVETGSPEAIHPNERVADKVDNAEQLELSKTVPPKKRYRQSRMREERA